MADYEVLINGGGPVGMGLAIELGQRGVRTCVVERHHRPQPIPKGQNLTQRTAEHFRAWGCEDALRRAHPLPEGAGIGGLTTYGTLLSEHHVSWLNRAQVRDFYACANARLPQYAAEAVLRARVAELPAVDVLYGWTGRALSQTAEEVQLDLAETDGPGTRRLAARYAVGADGARSTLREAAGIAETRSDHDRRMALIVFTSPALHDLLERYPGKAFYKVLHPDYEGYWLFFGRVDHGRSWFFHAPVPPDTTRETLDAEGLLHRAVGRSVPLEVDHVGFWDLRVALADRYRAGRAFVAGDAAHSHPPYGGYGINTGLEDARNLGWKLAAVLRGWGGPALLDSYDAERRPVFASTARDFIETFIEEDRAFLAAHSPETDGAAFAEAFARHNGEATGVTDFEPHYEGSPLIGGPGAPGAVGDHRVAARAGHHLTPRPLEDGRSTFDALGPGFTLLAFGAGEPEIAAFVHAAEETGLPLTVVRGGPALARAYGAPLVLVRPDEFVAWAGAEDDAAAILARAAGRAEIPAGAEI
jgi:2-polyprenyl-6-methoxyphenol hydroxylase-like FAD-dependent oxidoreductase